MMTFACILFGAIGISLFQSHREKTGQRHKFYSDPLEGPSGSCYPDCIKCKSLVNGRRITKLEKALK